MAHENGITLSPKASFILGLIGGVLVLCTLGFFILLGMVLDGSVDTAKKAKAPSAAAPTAAAPTAAAPTGGDAVGPFRPIDDNDHIRGAKNPSVTLIEYSDFECPFCGRFHPSMAQLLEDYGDDVQWVYRHFPLSFHPQARPAANAAECAAEQGDFWEYSDQLFANQTLLSDSYYRSLAADLGLNTSKFNDCLDARKYDGDISADLNDGSTAGVTGTPGTILVASDGSTQLIPGAIPYEQLKAIVESAL